MQKTQVQSLDQEDLLDREWKAIPMLLSDKSHGQKSLEGYSP